MMYIWKGRKPHWRAVRVASLDGKRQTFDLVPIAPGDTFEPSDQEIRSHGDLMDPVGASLHVAEPARETAMAAAALEDAQEVRGRGRQRGP